MALKVLHVLDHSLPLHSGYAFRTQSILRAQREAGWDAVCLTSPRQGPADLPLESIDGWRIYRTAMRQGLASRLAAADAGLVMWATAKRLEQVISQERPDILHAHSPILNAFPVIRAARRHGIPSVYEVRSNWEDAAVDHGTARRNGLRYLASRHLETLAMRRADALTTICEGLRDDIVGRGIDPEKITIVPNAIDFGSFGSSAAKDPGLAQSLGLGGGPVLGFIGSYYTYEGLHLLIEALHLLIPALPAVQLLLAGGGPAEPALRKRVRSLGLDGRVIFAGRVAHERIGALYDLVDILVYPRISMRLTELVTPLKPLEAMARGRIVLASSVGGHRELIRDGETGYLFAPGDSHALAEAVLSSLARQEDWPGIRDAGRQFIESERAWSTVVTRYRPLYERLTKPRSAH